MSRPHWVQVHVDLFDNPKILRAQHAAGADAVACYLRAICYSAAHLTDGWIPEPMPARWGYGAQHTEALEAAGLWVPLEITDHGGWLIHDYAEHQISRAEWERKVLQRKEAARRRWAK